jgi:spore germination cell wall hydrolase CwlJ-like protein
LHAKRERAGLYLHNAVMEAQPYGELDDAHLLALCIWREARGEGMFGRRGVGCVVRNRVNHGGYGVGYPGAILKPWQFSSFNTSDINAALWPIDGSLDWMGCLAEANDVLAGIDDVTNGALLYFSPPLTAPPHAWGNVIATAHIGNLNFYKPAPTELNLQGDA